jgi:hypothetical protein
MGRLACRQWRCRTRTKACRCVLSARCCTASLHVFTLHCVCAHADHVRSHAQGILHVIPMQLISYYLAVMKGFNVDMPVCVDVFGDSCVMHRCVAQFGQVCDC